MRPAIAALLATGICAACGSSPTDHSPEGLRNRALAMMFFAADDEGHPLQYDFSQTPAIALAALGAALVADVLFSVASATRVVRPPAASRLSRRRRPGGRPA